MSKIEMRKLDRVIVAILIAAILFAGASNLITAQTADANGATIDVNDRPLNINGASSFEVQSSNSVQVFAADEQSGAVTVTTSIVTVTVWTK